MSIVEENTRHMQRMRGLNCCLGSLAKIASHPNSTAGYEELLRCYLDMGMVEEAGAIEFLISEKFRAKGSDTDPEQQGDDKALS